MNKIEWKLQRTHSPAKCLKNRACFTRLHPLGSILREKKSAQCTTKIPIQRIQTEHQNMWIGMQQKNVFQSSRFMLIINKRSLWIMFVYVHESTRAFFCTEILIIVCRWWYNYQNLSSKDEIGLSYACVSVTENSANDERRWTVSLHYTLNIILWW